MLSDVYQIAPEFIDDHKRKALNKKKAWKYGYDAEWDLIVISKDGTVGEVYYIQGIYIGLPEVPDEIKDRENNKWIPHEYPKELSRIKTEFEYNNESDAFKAKWDPYIDEQFERREKGHWFINNGKPTYMTGGHYMLLQWSPIDVGLAHFRESDRLWYIHWEACVADNRCYGQVFTKTRRSGFSVRASSEIANAGTIYRDANLGILSKTGVDAQKLFTGKLVPMVQKYPFFFRPIQDGMDKPKKELSFRVPSTKLTKRSMFKATEPESVSGLDTTIDWLNTDDNSYDSQKLLRLVHDEAGKWLKPNNIKKSWEVVQTCLRTGSRIVGKCLMGSTVNAHDKGGGNFKDIVEDSNPLERDNNGQTKSGLYALFIPMEDCFEGHIDEYGMPVYETPTKPIMGVDGHWITQGSVTWWMNKYESLKADSEALNEFLRQNPRTYAHAFRDESKECLFNLTKLYDQLDYNDGLMRQGVVVRGNFSWRDGIKESEVLWTPDKNGRFYVTWIPPRHLQNRVRKQNGLKYPENDHLGAFGADTYDISGVVGGGGSKGALHGKTGFHMEDKVPVDFFFLEYISRPPTFEIFFEDVVMALHFYGMPVLGENVKPRVLQELRRRGYRPFSLNRPDKRKDQLSKSELEIGGIPASDDVLNAHANALETYIEKQVGYDTEGHYRDPSEMGNMYFERTVRDWISFDIKNRTKHDASVSSGLAILATNKHTIAKSTDDKIVVNLPTYNNRGMISKMNGVQD